MRNEAVVKVGIVGAEMNGHQKSNNLTGNNLITWSNEYVFSENSVSPVFDKPINRPKIRSSGTFGPSICLEVTALTGKLIRTRNYSSEFTRFFKHMIGNWQLIDVLDNYITIRDTSSQSPNNKRQDGLRREETRRRPRNRLQNQVLRVRI